MRDPLRVAIARHVRRYAGSYARAGLYFAIPFLGAVIDGASTPAAFLVGLVALRAFIDSHISRDASAPEAP